MELVLDELGECIPDPCGVERELEAQEAARIIRAFLDALPVTERRVFLRRYWYMDPVAVIARDLGFSESKTTSMLFRLRRRLRDRLEGEGYL